jgi:hypothetical protein
MVITINENKIDVKMTIGLIADIVNYKKRYEPESGVSMGGYLAGLQSENHVIDIVLDCITYSHLFERKAKGLPVKVTYGDALTWLMANLEEAKELIMELKDSMPKATNEEPITDGKKKATSLKKV